DENLRIGISGCESMCGLSYNQVVGVLSGRVIAGRWKYYGPVPRDGGAASSAGTVGPAGVNVNRPRPQPCEGVKAGVSVPLWHVKHETISSSRSSLIAITSEIMRRLTAFSCLSSAA